MEQHRAAPEEQIKTLHWVIGSGLVKDWSVAVDGGANVGDWSSVMADHFGAVHAFEPGGMFACRKRNVVLHRAALLDRLCRVVLCTRKANDRGWYVKPDKRGPLRATTIDALGLSSCGLIKLDLEGAEGHALLGARSTLRRYKPLVIMEVGKEKRKRPSLGDRVARRILKGLGYRLVYAAAPDEVWS